MFEIHSKQLSEDSAGRFTAFASDLRWQPGLVPRQFTVADRKIGNGRTFHLMGVTEEKFVYQQSLGCVSIVVFND